MEKWPAKRVGSLKGDNFDVFNYHSASEIWPDKDLDFLIFGV